MMAPASRPAGLGQTHGMAPATVILEQNVAAAAERAAARIAEIIAERADAGSECFLALCGGTTPGQLYRRLASLPLAEKIAWDRVQIFFGDERDVPQDHVENNYRLVTKTLLDHVPIPLAHVHPMPADCRDLTAAAEQYENLIRRLVPAEKDDVPVFDLILLGMGAEGHTASLYPHTPALAERHRLVAAQFVPVIGRNRMTFTFPLINAAAPSSCILASGLSGRPSRARCQEVASCRCLILGRNPNFRYSPIAAILAVLVPRTAWVCPSPARGFMTAARRGLASPRCWNWGTMATQCTRPQAGLSYHAVAVPIAAPSAPQR